MQTFQQYIGGAFVSGSKHFESLDPSTGAVWAQMPDATVEDVDHAVMAAQQALFAPAWAGMTATARGKLLLRLADLIAENAHRLAELETRDTGKIIRETSAQIAYVAEYYVELATFPVGGQNRTCACRRMHCSVESVRRRARTDAGVRAHLRSGRFPDRGSECHHRRSGRGRGAHTSS